MIVYCGFGMCVPVIREQSDSMATPEKASKDKYRFNFVGLEKIIALLTLCGKTAIVAHVAEWRLMLGRFTQL